MENNTKIYIGVGAAALIAFLLFRNKASAQKPIVKTDGTIGGGTTTGSGTTGGGTTGGTTGGTGGGTTTSGGTGATRGVDYPACPNGTIRYPNGECLPIDSEPPARPMPSTPPAASYPEAPNPSYNKPYDPYDNSEYNIDNTYFRERESYYKDIFGLGIDENYKYR
jgi:hypothetical protein